MTRSRMSLLATTFFLSFSFGNTAEAQVVTKGYSTRMVLDGPIAQGTNQTLTGRGAPVAPGVFVELWRVPFNGKAESVMSVETIADFEGSFVFTGVDVNGGDSFFVTLSRSWQFNTDGDTEDWDRDVSPDASLSVSDGALKVTVENNTGFMDAFFFNRFFYDSHFYRVMEIRLKNPATNPTSKLGVFFGDPWSTYMNRHIALIPNAMSDFQTLLIPMNVDEDKIKPGGFQSGLDGLWDTGRLNDVIRLDPLDGVPLAERPLATGTVFEIDYIRIREDYRLDFDSDGDRMGLDSTSGLTQLSVADGFLTFEANGMPSLFSSIATGKLESGWFSRFVIGMDNFNVSNAFTSVAVNFNDDDSGVTYHDDDGSLQQAELFLSFDGRQDAHADMDSMTASGTEWTEDGRVPVEGLEFVLPNDSVTGDMIRVDYMGFIPADPYGPSDAVSVPLPNNPPVATVVTTPDPAEVELRTGSAEVVLDGSLSDDGDGGTQGLTFSWSKVSGPAGDVILSPADPVTVVTFTELGEYVYELTVDDGQPVDSEASTMVTVTVNPFIPFFLRGDTDSNGVSLESSDAMHLSNFLFETEVPTPLPCHDAADVDDNGVLNTDDVVLILSYQSGAIPFPFSMVGCEADMTDDALPECDYPEDLCLDPSVADPFDKHDEDSTKEEIKVLKKELKEVRKTAKAASKEEQKADGLG